MTSYSGRQWLKLWIGAAGMVAMLMSLVASCYLYNVRVDWSPGDRFTLSDHAHQVLDTVDKPVKITAFIRTQDARNPLLKDLLWQAARENDHITYDVVDVNRNPGMAARFGVSAYGAVVVECEGQRADFSNPSESQLMASLLKVVQKGKKVYFVIGHGECSTQNTDRRDGCSQARDALSLESYDVETLNLVAVSAIPDDADAVVIAGPRDDFLDNETHVLEAYLDRGGSLLAMIDPFRAPRLVSLLGLYGIDVGPNVVVDVDNRLAGGETFSIVAADRNRRHLVTSTLGSPPLFSAAASLVAHGDADSDWIATRLLETGPRSWASFDPEVLRAGAANFVAGRDINGPVSVGVDMSLPASAKGVAEGERTNLIVYGDSDFISNRFLDYLGNKDLLVNSVNWLTREERLMGTRPQRKEFGARQFFVSQSQGASVFWGSAIIEPGLFLLIGIGVWIRRRMAP
jgi:ABC-type uncharacterized transport system involved in gliding motility auxiliary subunit